MSDSDDDQATFKRAKLVHYGSLAENAQTIKKLKESSGGGEKSKLGDYSENINVSNEHYELDKIVDPAKVAAEAEFERRKRARQLTLPTDDGEVKALLRSLDQPICLYGEDKPDRRERLRTILSTLEEDEAQRILRKEEPKVEKPKEDDTTWYHPGTEELVQARIFIAKYSLPRAQARLDRARQRQQMPPQQRAIKLQETHKWVRGLTNFSSQVGDTRPVSHCEFSPNSQYLATAGWSGLCKLWSVPKCELIRTYKGHDDYTGCIAFHPESTLSLSPSAVNLASCARNGSVLLWNLENDEPIADIEGHKPYRVSKLAFHPSGRFLATCCFDKSWRLFDMEQNQEILFQEGHSKEVFDICFQCDGSVALTGGFDCYGRVWDLRTGRCIMFLEGHQKPIYTVNFAPNGYQMSTGSGDNQCKIWDLRMRRCFYTLPAHQSLVAKLCFEYKTGEFMLTASYDKTIKLWSNPGWQPLKTLTGHEGKVMCVDVSRDGKFIASASSDRTFKLWAPD